ncbi:MAG: hypothetical protein R6V05_04885 [Candidatus Brocadiia bacterium]
MADAEELAYALVTPYSLHKSRTGGILARLLWTNVRLVAARMYAPTPGGDFIERYCDAIYDPEERRVPLRYQKLLIDYVIDNFGRPNVRGISNRLAVLIFQGPNALQEITDAVGHISPDVRGDDVRGTFGDYFREDQHALAGNPDYERRLALLDKYERLNDAELTEPRNDFFEPAVLTATTSEMNRAHLRLFRDAAYSDGGFVLGALEGVAPEEMESSLVVLKPESLHHRNPLPGNLMDFFSRAGMFVTAMKVLELDVERAKEFYSLKLPQFREQLRGMVARRARSITRRARMLAEQAVERMAADPAQAFQPKHALEAARRAEELFCPEPGPGQVKPPIVRLIYRELEGRLDDLDPPDALYDALADDLKDEHAQAEFDELIRYMTGKDPVTGQPLDPGEERRCMALLYSGTDALSVIRKRLKELREVYGQNVLQNRAHASDPEEDPAKEMRVLGMPTAWQQESRPCDVERVVDQFLSAELEA